ncbi:p23 co-chaperone, putative [Eimeria necatrix]|uniref:p23 co-chaperone, putative n=1 Tax=Eimeria necatrix TaxID=51315 RepID=U6N074_9EIME|nr:p23 co-chaperone, putative [Eimeria necatrix]CDJ69888.1 p23 co-chaperone, putative [Eimeria necatrix]
MAKETCTPECLWAERKPFVFLTVGVSSPENLKVNLQEKSLDFCCSKGDKQYHCHLDFPEPINVEESKYSTQRNVQFKLVKKEAKRWRRVCKEKQHFIKCDWSKWVDSEEEEGGPLGDFGDFDMDSMGFGGLGGAPQGPLDFGGLGEGGPLGGPLGGLDNEDSDDEADLRDLDAPLDQEGAPPAAAAAAAAAAAPGEQQQAEKEEGAPAAAAAAADEQQQKAQQQHNQDARPEANARS